MDTRISPHPKLLSGLVVSLLVLLACNLPFGPTAQVDSIKQTAEALQQELQITASALALPVPEEALKTAQALEQTQGLEQTAAALNLESVQQTAQAMLTGGQDATPAPSPTAAPGQVHTLIPGNPPASKSELTDTSSQDSAERKVAPGGDNLNANLFERPFDASMLYRPDVDILKAELTTDETFFYVTIYLAGTQAEKGALLAHYALEIDVNIDGRGDFLIWSAPPTSTDWSVEAVRVLADPDKDVGGKRALVSDAPAQGNGYEKLVFSASQFSDPDLAWSRLVPGQPDAVQIAFKPAAIDAPKSFLWGVWADDGPKNPSAFDYNDHFTAQDAGSPLEKDPQYPLKQLFLVDNTCRVGYNRSFLASDPGVCGGTAPTLVVPTGLPEITPPPPPSLP